MLERCLRYAGMYKGTGCSNFGTPLPLTGAGSLRIYVRALRNIRTARCIFFAQTRRSAAPLGRVSRPRSYASIRRARLTLPKRHKWLVCAKKMHLALAYMQFL